MSSLREAAQQALAVLSDDVRRCNLLLLDKITNDLRAALALQETAMTDRTICGTCGSQYDQQGRCECHTAGRAMDRDTVIRLAWEAEGDEQQHGMWVMHVEDLERFAALVAAHEREECAKYLESREDGVWANTCAAAIRSRA